MMLTKALFFSSISTVKSGLQSLRRGGKIEAFQAESIHDNQQQGPDLQLQSDPSINSGELVELLAQELENLVVSCKDDVPDRDILGHAVATDDEGEVKRATGEELRHLVVKEAVNETLQAESSSRSGEKNVGDVRHFVDEAIEWHGLKRCIEDDPKECRVLDERAVEKEEEKGDVHGVGNEKILGHMEDALKENHKIGLGDGDGGSDFVSYEHNDEERRSESGSNCKSNRPRRRRTQRSKKTKKQTEENPERSGQIECKPSKETKKQKEENTERSGRIECKPPKKTKKQKEENPERPVQIECKPSKKEIKQKEENPERPGQIKFKPSKKTNKQMEENPERPGQIECKSSKKTKKQKEENPERPGQIECKFNLSSGGCKSGKSCKFNHSRGKTVVAPVVDYNFLDLPIRPGEKECAYYMRNGCCKHGRNCWFNHPEPTAVEGDDAPATYGNDEPVQLLSASQSNIPSWSPPRTSDATAAFVPTMYSPSPDWNGIQVPAPAQIYPSSESDTNMYTHHQQQMLVSDYPERPGQPECSRFMKTGDCKYRSACKFHHPKSHITKPTPSVPSDKGLPLRPDQNICTHWSV